MKLGVGFVLVLSSLLSGGCASGPSGHPTASSLNVYRAASQLPAELRRVAVLPMTCEGNWIAKEGRTALQPILQTELGKTRYFELEFLSAEQMRAITGQSEWTSDARLPSDFFARLHEVTGCDAVFFCRLTVFRPYPPLAVGWSLKLVDVQQRRIVWAIDQVFDAGMPAVASRAQDYSSHNISEPGALRESDGILESPRWFGQYAAAAALETLPTR